MAYDPVILASVGISIALLAFLVWLMLRAGRTPEWAAVSRGAREGRDRRENGGR